MAMQGSRTHQDGATMRAWHPVYIPPAPHGPIWIAISVLLWTVLGINACTKKFAATARITNTNDVSLTDSYPDCSDTSDRLQIICDDHLCLNPAPL